MTTRFTLGLLGRIPCWFSWDCDIWPW